VATSLVALSHQYRIGNSYKAQKKIKFSQLQRWEVAESTIIVCEILLYTWQLPVYAHICFILHNNRVYNHQFMHTSVLFCTTTESAITSLCTHLHVFHKQWWNYSWCRSIYWLAVS